MVPFAALSASYFAHVGFFNPYLPLWLKSLDLSLFTISLLVSVQSATRIFAPLGWAWLSDHSGERVRLLRYCALAAWLVSLALHLALPVAWLALVLLLLCTNTSALTPMSETAMAHVLSQGGVFNARQYGRVRLWGSLGFLLAVFLAGQWFEHHGMGSFASWTSATLGLVVLCAWQLPNQREPVALEARKARLGPLLRQRPVQWFFLAVFFHVLAHMSLYIFFSLYLDSLGYNKAWIGALWAVSVIAEVVWFYGQGRWLPRCSAAVWLMLCAAATALRMGLSAAFGGQLWLMLLLQCLHAWTFAAHHSVCISWVSTHFTGRLRGRGQALYTVWGYGVSGVLAGFAGGSLSQHLGLASVFWAATASACLAVLAAYRLWRATAQV